MQVLVAYASKYGGTAEIARKIGQGLNQAGLRTETVPVEKVKDLTPYEAVVLGSGVYIGKWRKEATKFLKANEKALGNRPVWLFSSGPTGEGDAVELLDGWRLPKALQPIVDRIQPHDIAVFHGVVDVKKLSAIHRWMINKVDSPVGDYRDWDAITDWATMIADSLNG